MGYVIALLAVAAVAGGLYVWYQSKNKSSKKQVRLKDSNVVRDLKKQVNAAQPKAFKKEMRLLNSQMERMENKLDSLDRGLKDYFGDYSISYQKFAATVGAVEDLFADNTRKILKRIDVFDGEGYNDLYRRHEEYTEAIQPYLAHFDYVKDRLAENEEILSRMDRLMLEVNDLNESQIPIDQLPAMQEINDLIEQTKLYAQNQ